MSTYLHDIIGRATGLTDAEKRHAHSELDLPPGQDEMVRTGQIGLLCALLQRWCEDNGMPFASAADLLATLPPDDPRANWLRTYWHLWDQSDLTETD